MKEEKIDAGKYRVCPLGDRVLVAPAPEKDKLGSIIVPMGSRHRPDRGEVLATGPEAKHLAEGDRVLFHKGAGVEVCVNNREEPLLIMRQGDVYSKLEGRGNG